MDPLEKPKERHRRKKLKETDYAGYGKFHDIVDTEKTVRVKFTATEALRVVSAITDAIAQGFDISIVFYKEKNQAGVYTRAIEKQ